MKSLVALIFLSIFVSGCQTSPVKRFTNTQRWGDEESFFTSNWKSVFVSFSLDEVKALPEPPKADSTEFLRERLYLLAIAAARSEQDQVKIESQKHVCGFYFDGYRIGFNPKLDDLLMDAYMDSRLFGFMAKYYFDRVRPSFLIVDLNPSITNPDHAAYPSNHSIQASLLALILGEIFPEKKSAMVVAARNIARNRELAGVHYPSDSELGFSMAEMTFRKLLKNASFLERLREAKKAKAKWKLRSEEFSNSDFNSCLRYTSSYAIANRVWK